MNSSSLWDAFYSLTQKLQKKYRPNGSLESFNVVIQELDDMVLMMLSISELFTFTQGALTQEQVAFGCHIGFHPYKEFLLFQYTWAYMIENGYLTESESSSYVISPAFSKWRSNLAQKLTEVNINSFKDAFEE